MDRYVLAKNQDLCKRLSILPRGRNHVAVVVDALLRGLSGRPLRSFSAGLYIYIGQSVYSNYGGCGCDRAQKQVETVTVIL